MVRVAGPETHTASGSATSENGRSVAGPVVSPCAPRYRKLSGEPMDPVGRRISCVASALGVVARVASSRPRW